MFASKKVFLLIGIYCSLTISSARHVQSPSENVVTIDTPLGKVRGTIMFSRKNNRYYAFRGIPYAEAPIGERRFRPAVPITSWNGTLDATKDGPICPQPERPEMTGLMAEDCLILNVYTKNLTGSLPVIVFIHGGAFEISGSHSEACWGQQYLMDKEILLVTFNYRLGPFGFLSTGTKDAPGNEGLKDQVMVLRWVRDNIRSFGGDPNSVTIWGHSSGSMCVTMHMVSPLSQGLFHRAIAMSGSSTSHYVFENQQRTKYIAEKLGCSNNSPKLMLECLRKIPYTNFTKFSDLQTIPGIIRCDWYLEIEKDFGQERFMEEHPINLFAKGKFSKIPILTGITKDELGPNGYVIYYENPKVLKEFNTNFNEIASYTLAYDPNLTNVSKTLRRVYLNNENVSNSNLKKFEDMFADGYFMHGEHMLLNLARKYTDVYYYRQDYMGRYSFSYGLDDKPIGVFHSDDLLYVFVHTIKAPMFKETDPENFMVERLTELWTSFARTGNPNNNNNPWTSDIVWEPSNKDNLKALYINRNCSLSTEPYQDRMKLWDELFPVKLFLK